ncbi:hypothetical protein C1645_830950 [Glomus cerebriforme]|uniref:NUDE domain-containing protein n=1 Tax=Glomus cerebriforme TaxID=658196 RepID=A0A397SMN5_9GLOM|nr:hypothetical protein C1645_830950 [Glomus cerebriforme]
MSNMYTLKDIKNRGHRLGSVYEQELKKKLKTAIDFNSEITDFNEKLQTENFEELTLAQKASSSDKVTILSLEAKIVELKEIDFLRLELEQAKEELNSKEYTIECMEKGKESSDSIYKWEIDILSLGPSIPPMNNSSQLSALNPSSQIISVGGTEAVPLLATVPIITTSLILPMLTYSILTLVLIAII